MGLKRFEGMELHFEKRLDLALAIIASTTETSSIGYKYFYLGGPGKDFISRVRVVGGGWVSFRVLGLGFTRRVLETYHMITSVTRIMSLLSPHDPPSRVQDLGS